jgi:hypothetical protein
MNEGPIRVAILQTMIGVDIIERVRIAPGLIVTSSDLATDAFSFPRSSSWLTYSWSPPGSLGTRRTRLRMNGPITSEQLASVTDNSQVGQRASKGQEP